MPLHHSLKAISVTWSPLSWFLGCLLSCQKSTDTESWHQVRLLWQQLRMWGVPWAVQEECGSLQKAGKTPAHWAILTFTQQARKRRIPLVCTDTADAEPVPLKIGWRLAWWLSPVFHEAGSCSGQHTRHGDRRYRVRKVKNKTTTVCRQQDCKWRNLRNVEEWGQAPRAQVTRVTIKSTHEPHLAPSRQLEVSIQKHSFILLPNKENI